jgi:MFS family permease
MFVLCVVWFGSTFGYYGTIIAVTRIFSNVDDEDSDKTSFDYMAFFISALAEIVGAIMIFRMIERLGRVPTLVFSLLGAGVALFLLCFVVTFGRPLQIFFAFSSRVFEMMISSTVWIMTPELLSTQVRASGHGIASAIARIGGCLSPFVVTKEPLPTVGIIMLLVHVLTAAVSLRLPETKGVAMGSAVEVGVLSHSRCSPDQDDAQGID